MSDYFDRLEAELRAAVPRAVSARTSAPRPRRRRFQVRSGMAPAAIGVAVALAVAVLGVLLLGRAHPASQTAGPKPAAPGAVPTLSELLDNFVTLRGAQTAADRSWQPKPDAGAREVLTLTRLARTLPNGDRVFLSVERLRTPQAGQAPGPYSMKVWVVDPTGSAGSASFGPKARYTVLPFEFPSSEVLTQDPAAAQRGPVWTSVVPDGVESVRWTFACTGPRLLCVGRKPLTMTLPVQGNVAVAANLPETGECAGTTVSCLSPSTVTWYGSASRQVLAHFTRKSVISGPPFVLHKPSRPTDDILSGRGIAGVKFGQPRAAVATALDRLLGVPGTRPRPYLRECGVDSLAKWWDPSSASGQPSLIAYFGHGRFVGYEYGDGGAQVIRRLPSHGVVLATTRGLTIGDTLERGRQLYGNAFKISAAQGGSWSVNTSSGAIDGYASDVPRPGNPGAVKVKTIDAGNVGCPALSP